MKVTFPEGASITDPDKLFDNGLTGKKWRTIDYFESDKVREQELADLIRSAVVYNLAKKSLLSGIVSA